jgi:hypothetical protein
MTADDSADHDRLKKKVDKYGKAVIMAAESEASEIIRRRLYEWQGRPDDARATTASYSDWLLEQLFLHDGPPLVLKRDNGSNLNHQAVDEVLARYLVIPLNSPPHYPPYNGAMECAVRDENPPGREDPRRPSDHGLPGTSLGGGAGARPEPSLPPLSRGQGGLRGVSPGKARPEGLHSPQAKGGF